MVNTSGMAKCFIVAASALALLAGCGGGGETGQSAAAPRPPADALAWEPPQTFADNTAMDPYTELGYYEFYIRTDRNFTEADLPMAQVAAVVDVLAADGRTYISELTTDFFLDNLRPFAPAGHRYYLSIRAVGIDGLKSAFSDPVTWDLV